MKRHDVVSFQGGCGCVYVLSKVISLPVVDTDGRNEDFKVNFLKNCMGFICILHCIQAKKSVLHYTVFSLTYTHPCLPFIRRGNVVCPFLDWSLPYPTASTRYQGSQS